MSDARTGGGHAVSRETVSLRASLDVLLALALGLVALALVAVSPPEESSLVRVAIAMGAVLFVPGFLSLAALYPHPTAPMPHERAVLSFGLSLAVVSLVGLGLNFSPWGIRPIPFMVALALGDVAASAVAILRRRGRARMGDVTTPRVAWRSASRLVLPAASLAAAGLGAIVVLALLGSPRQEQFTEFYLRGPGGSIEDLPGSVRANDEVATRLTVANREGSTQRYRVEPVLGGQRLPSIEIGDLVGEAVWERVLSFPATGTIGRTTLRFDLYRGTESGPYRSLVLRLEVRPE